MVDYAAPSGVLAVVVLGAVMLGGGKLSLLHHAAHEQHVLIAQLTHMCNQAIFLIAGIVGERLILERTSRGGSYLHREPMMWVHMLALCVVLHLTRALITALFMPALRH